MPRAGPGRGGRIHSRARRCYKNLLVSDAILRLSLGSALGAAAAAALGGHKHRRPVRSPPGSQRRGHRRQRGRGGGGGGGTRKERRTWTGVARAAAAAAAGAREDPALSLPTLVPLSPPGARGWPGPGPPAAVRGSRVCPAGRTGLGEGERGWERAGGAGKEGRRGLLFLGGPDSCVAAGAAAAAPEVSLGKPVLGRGGGCPALREKASPGSPLQHSPEYFNDPFSLLF